MQDGSLKTIRELREGNQRDWSTADNFEPDGDGSVFMGAAVKRSAAQKVRRMSYIWIIPNSIVGASQLSH